LKDHALSDAVTRSIDHIETVTDSNVSGPLPFLPHRHSPPALRR
jgi:hypothetical protein